jgi:hypothetical protein
MFKYYDAPLLLNVCFVANVFPFGEIFIKKISVEFFFQKKIKIKIAMFLHIV